MHSWERLFSLSFALHFNLLKWNEVLEKESREQEEDSLSLFPSKWLLAFSSTSSSSASPLVVDSSQRRTFFSSRSRTRSVHPKKERVWNAFELMLTFCKLTSFGLSCLPRLLPFPWFCRLILCVLLSWCLMPFSLSFGKERICVSHSLPLNRKYFHSHPLCLLSPSFGSLFPWDFDVCLSFLQYLLVH
jgi:hypothetical protein